jgi:hypothetical protein
MNKFEDEIVVSSNKETQKQSASKRMTIDDPNIRNAIRNTGINKLLMIFFKKINEKYLAAKQSEIQSLEKNKYFHELDIVQSKVIENFEKESN